MRKVAIDNDYFATLETAQRLDLVRHLIENSEIVPLVRGPTGIGKTVLALRLKQLASANWSVCYFEADASMSPEHLLVSMARCIGWSDIKGDQLEGLVERFGLMRERGHIPVLLVDDAQFLPPASLITLLRLYERQRAGEPLISLVLFADERIDVLLSTPQLQIMSPQAIQTIGLPLFNRQDTTIYMHYLLQVEGLPADLELEDARLTKLFRETKGNPGLLRQAILNAIGDEDKRSGSYTPKIIGASLLLLLIFGLLLFQDEINRLFQSPEPTPVEATAEPMPLQQQEVEIDPIQADAMQGLNQNEESAQEEEPTAIAEPVGLEESAAVPFEQPLLLTDSSNNWVDGVAQEDDIKVQGTEFQAPEIVHAPSEETPDRVEEKPEILIETAQDSVVSDASMVDEAVVIEPKIQAQMDLLQREDWVLTRPAVHYTLQLLGVEKLQSLKEFIERHHLRDKAFYIETERNGKSWYPLLWGEYPDKLSAIESSHQLPLEVQSKGTWVRSFGALQDLLEK